MDTIQSWTSSDDSERVEMIKSVWVQGDSFRSIASKLSAEIGVEVTRNAVAGVFGRRRSDLSGIYLGKAPKNFGVKIRAHVMSPDGMVTESVESSSVEKSSFAEICAEQEPLMLDLVKLTDRTCKWPVQDDPYKFCGVNSGTTPRPYCEYHTKMAFIPAKARSGRPFIHRRKAIGAR